MIDINLLPPEYGPKKAITPINLVIIFLSSLILLSLLLSSFRLTATVQDYSDRLKYSESQIKYHKLQAEDVRKLAERVKQLKVRLSLVEELLREQVIWSDKLVELCQCLPQHGSWIDMLTVERASSGSRAAQPANTTGGSITAYVAGDIVSIDKVSQFVGRLENSETFSNIIFDSATTLASGMADDMFTFKLSVEILTPDEGL